MQIATTASLLGLAAASAITADAATTAGNHTVSLMSAAQYCPAQEYNVDYPGNDLYQYQMSNDDCCAICLDSSDCGAYTWTNYQGGSCYLKSKKTTTAYKAPNADGSATTISAELYRCQPLLKDIDFQGEDLSVHLEDHPENCCIICNNSRLCFGFSWSNYNGGTCWLKGESSLKVKANPGVYSAYLR